MLQRCTIDGPAPPQAPPTVPSGPGPTQAGTLRPCEPGDLPAVARLFQRTFRRHRRGSTEAVESHLRDILFGHPWRDPEIGSRVCIGPEDRLEGFVGVLPVRLSLDGRPVRAALATSLMVDPTVAGPLVGARLLRAALHGPQELSFGETSNPIAQRMWERLGGRTVPPYSMEWVRLLRPAAGSLALAAAIVPPLGWLGPLGRLADLALARPPASPEKPAARAIEAADDDAVIGLMIRLAGRWRLAPAWDASVLRWQLAHAAHKKRYGPLVRLVVRNPKGRDLGCVLYCGRPHDIALVLQVLAEPDQVGTVLDALIADAFARGCVALRGRTEPDLLGALQLRDCLFVHRSSVTVRSADRDILAAVASGDALLTGIAGEGWTRMIGDFA